MDISICIVSFNTRDLLHDCLRSVIECASGMSYEIIVVDNASADGTADMVESAFPQVRLIRNQRNRYFSRGNNQAFHEATGRYVLVLNPDTIVPAGALQKMVSYMERNPRVGVAGCAVRLPDGNLSLNGWKFHTIGSLLANHLVARLFFRNAGFRREALMLDWDRSASRRVDVVMGSFLIIRREALKHVGGFDEGYRLYYTDDEFCQRINRAAWEVWYVGEVWIHHIHQQSSKQLPVVKMWWIYTCDLLLYFRQYHSRLTFALMLPIVLVDLLVKTAVFLPRDAWQRLQRVYR